MSQRSIALVGDAGAGYRPEAAEQALQHSMSALGSAVEQRWFGSEQAATAQGLAALSECEGVWIVPGSPYKSLEGVLRAIQFAREQGRPLLGTCAGFQHLVLEYARNVLGSDRAAHAEYDAEAKDPLISRLSCSLVGRTQRVTFHPESMIAAVYDRTFSEEQFYCNFGINTEAARSLSGKLKVVGWDPEGQPRAVELAGHPFFVGTLFIPQYSSTMAQPHPLVSGFIRAVLAGPRAAHPGLLFS